MKNYFILFLLSIFLISGCRKPDPSAHLKSPEISYLESKLAEVTTEIIDIKFLVAENFAEYQKSIESQSNIKARRTKYFQAIDRLERANQNRLWLEKKIESVKFEAKKRYLIAYNNKTEEQTDTWQINRDNMPIQKLIEARATLKIRSPAEPKQASSGGH